MQIILLHLNIVLKCHHTPTMGGERWDERFGEKFTKLHSNSYHSQL